MKLIPVLTIQYLDKNIHLLTVIVALALSAMLNVSPVAAQQNYVIQGPDGGDCESYPLNGSWEDEFSTCRLFSLAIYANQTLTIRRDAMAVIQTQVVNFGTITVVANDPTGSAQLLIGERRSANAFINYGTLIIAPRPSPDKPAGSAGLSNYHLSMQNMGSGVIVIAHAVVDGLRIGGVFNNFGDITNSGAIFNAGFFHNSGPRIQPERGIIDNQPGAMFFMSGILENLGTIDGLISFNPGGICTGNCP